MIAYALYPAASKAAQALYSLVVSQARHPAFYTKFGIADTVDGRFDMIVLHVFLVLRFIVSQRETRENKGLAQSLIDIMFHDMDHNLRAMGVSDLQVGRKVKDMLRAFYGRVSAYETALTAQNDQLLADALQRNVYRNVTTQNANVKSLVHYVREVAALSTAWSMADLRRGRVSFVRPPCVPPCS